MIIFVYITLHRRKGERAEINIYERKEFKKNNVPSLQKKFF